MYLCRREGRGAGACFMRMVAASRLAIHTPPPSTHPHEEIPRLPLPRHGAAREAVGGLRAQVALLRGARARVRTCMNDRGTQPASGAHARGTSSCRGHAARVRHAARLHAQVLLPRSLGQRARGRGIIVPCWVPVPQPLRQVGQRLQGVLAHRWGGHVPWQLRAWLRSAAVRYKFSNKPKGKTALLPATLPTTPPPPSPLGARVVKRGQRVGVHAHGVRREDELVEGRVAPEAVARPPPARRGAGVWGGGDG